jgi:hypothetical protein
VTSVLYIEAIMGCSVGQSDGSFNALTIKWRQTTVIISTLAVLTVYIGQLISRVFAETEALTSSKKKAETVPFLAAILCQWAIMAPERRVTNGKMECNAIVSDHNPIYESTQRALKLIPGGR